MDKRFLRLSIGRVPPQARVADRRRDRRRRHLCGAPSRGIQQQRSTLGYGVWSTYAAESSSRSVFEFTTLCRAATYESHPVSSLSTMAYSPSSVKVAVTLASSMTGRLPGSAVRPETSRHVEMAVHEQRDLLLGHRGADEPVRAVSVVGVARPVKQRRPEQRQRDGAATCTSPGSASACGYHDPCRE